MTRKYQQGGQLTDTQQQGLQYLAQMYAQQTGKDPQQDQEGFMQFVQQLAQQAGVQDIGQLLDMIYQQAQGQAQAARRGAKLNYLKRLTGNCPEGEELVYFKAGGRMCSKCMAKKQKGDIIEEAKCGSKMKKKKGCGGFKVQKGQNGLKSQYSNKIKSFFDPKRMYNDVRRNGIIQRTFNNGEIMYPWTPNLTEEQRRAKFLEEGNENASLPTVQVKLKNGKTEVSMPYYSPFTSLNYFKNGGSLKGIPFKYQPGGQFVRKIKSSLTGGGYPKYTMETYNGKDLIANVNNKLDGIQRTINGNDTLYKYPVRDLYVNSKGDYFRTNNLQEPIKYNEERNPQIRQRNIIKWNNLNNQFNSLYDHLNQKGGIR